MNPLSLILVLAFAFFLQTGISRLRRIPRQTLNQYAQRYGTYLGIVLILLLVVTGRLPLLLTAFGALLALGYRVANLMQLFPALRQILSQFGMPWSTTGWGSGTGAHESTVQARFVRMSLDHARGELRGQVLEGQFARRWLNELSIDELLQLLTECQADHESATLVQAYLDKVHGEAWRTHSRGNSRKQGHSANSAAGKMGTEEALQVLGLKPGASKSAIVDAHRRLMQKVHPDRGGSDYLAAKLNQAKDILLGS